jgi:hypothetical protein
MTKWIAALGISAALAVATPDAAQAQTTKQDGLVNVSIGDVTVLQDVNVAAVVGIVAQICGLDLDVVANILSAAATAVDTGSRSYTVCKTGDGKVKITQN